jgi:hypothetical protein
MAPNIKATQKGKLRRVDRQAQERFLSSGFKSIGRSSLSTLPNGARTQYSIHGRG